MNILYLECKMGASGDMLMGALLELLPDPEDFFREMKCLENLGICITRQDSMKCGIHGTHIEVRAAGEVEHENAHDHGHAHVHRNYKELLGIVGEMDLPEKVKNDIASVYRLLAQAEAEAHQVPMDQIHFHEVGSMDALADIAGVCVLMNLLHPDRIIASPVHLGNGIVRCAHGYLPVPAPATANLLKGCPVYSGNIQSELCTPTGAALLRYFADEFGGMPEMVLTGIGYGMGTKDFPAANLLRCFMGKGY